jgi:RimJ/RimL family protein N-acetyltransferase
MSTFVPVLPGLPDLSRPSVRRDLLKESTWQLLQHPRRQRVPRRTLPLFSITPYAMATHGPDFLFYWYGLVRSLGEHAMLWGEVGLSPTQFLAAFARASLLVIHREEAAWTHGEGLLFLVWSDDVVPGLRARIHFWSHPHMRHPQVSLLLGHAGLRYLFEEQGYTLLEGRTPVTNTLALRFVRRLGFQMVATLPHAEWAWTAEGEKEAVDVVQSMLTPSMWDAREER